MELTLQETNLVRSSTINRLVLINAKLEAKLEGTELVLVENESLSNVQVGDVVQLNNGCLVKVSQVKNNEIFGTRYATLEHFYSSRWQSNGAFGSGEGDPCDFCIAKLLFKRVG